MTEFTQASNNLRKKIRANKRAEDRLKYGTVKRSRTKSASKKRTKGSQEGLASPGYVRREDGEEYRPPNQ
jgi:hypothetical protein